MENIIFLFTKDCLSLEALPCYSSTSAANYWRGSTPNIDELARKGTLFLRHYTAAPSTSMAMSAMLTGHYPYEFTSRKVYVDVKPNEFPSIFDIFQNRGYETHLLWDYRWMKMAYVYVREFGDESKTKIHNLPIGQAVGKLNKGESRCLVHDDALLKKTVDLIKNELDSIDLSKRQFIWLHLPHVIFGRRSYMDDIDVTDEILGFVRKLVGDESIYFSSDHGHMNMHKQKVSYGFDVYEPAIRIPLITPRINNLEKVIDVTSNVDLPSIILDHTIPKHDYVISETKYYVQSTRKTAFITNRYKYIYNSKDKREELYDLEWDSDENYNIVLEKYFDKDRRKTMVYDELYFYPNKDKALEKLDYFRKLRESMWREPSMKDKLNIKYYGTIKKLRAIFK